jgi:hypothetical protein
MNAETVIAVSQLIDKAVEALRTENTASLKPEDAQEYLAIQAEFSDCLRKTNDYCMSYQPFYSYVNAVADIYSIDRLREYLIKHDFDVIVDTVKDLASSFYNLGLRITNFQSALSQKYFSKNPFWRYLGDVLLCLSGIAQIVVGCVVPGFQGLIVSGAVTTASGFVRLVVDYHDAVNNAKVMGDIKKLQEKLSTAQGHMVGLSRAARTHADKVKLVSIAFGMKEEDEPSEATDALFKTFVKDMCASFDGLSQALDRAIDRKPDKPSVMQVMKTAAAGTATASSVATAAIVVVAANAQTGGAVEHAVLGVSWCVIS